MGWHPDQVRATSFSDFTAALEGHLVSKGVPPPLKQSDVAALDELERKYGGKTLKVEDG